MLINDRIEGMSGVCLTIHLAQVPSVRFIRFSISLNRGSSRNGIKYRSAFIRNNSQSRASKPLLSSTKALSLSPRAAYILAMRQLHRDVMSSVVFANLKNLRDVGMAERSRRLCLAHKALHAITIRRDVWRKNL